jgi:hypothetical protein
MASFDLDSADGTQAISAVQLPATLGQKVMAESLAVTMASNQPAIPVSVSSITSGGDELATFVVLAKDIAIGNNKSMLSIVNNSGSTVKVKVRELYLINSQTAAVTGVISDFELHRCVSHSAGTSITPQSYDTADSLDASVTARTGATIGTENAAILKRWEWSSDEWGVGTLDQEGNDHNTQANMNLLRQEKNCKPLTLRANEGFTFKHSVNSTAGTFDIMCVFTQESA